MPEDPLNSLGERNGRDGDKNDSTSGRKKQSEKKVKGKKRKTKEISSEKGQVSEGMKVRSGVQNGKGKKERMGRDQTGSSAVGGKIQNDLDFLKDSGVFSDI